VRRRWRAVLAEIRKASVSRYPAFSEAQANPSADGTSLIISFPVGGFRFEQAKSAESREILAHAITTVYGHDIPVTFVQDTGSAPGTNAKSSPPAPTPSPPPIIEPPPPPPPPRRAKTEELIPEPEPTINDISDDSLESDKTDNDTDASDAEAPEIPGAKSSAPPQEVSNIIDALGGTIIQQIAHTDDEERVQ
jgi:hypothetical protein